MHPTEGNLQAYVDGELPPGKRQEIVQHLSACAACREKTARISQRATRVHQALDQINADLFAPRISSSAARSRLEARLIQQEKPTMFKKWFSKRLRPVWAGILIFAVLALALALPPGRVIANNFLGLFRVERITVVPVNEDQLSNQLASATQLESLFAENVNYQGGGEIQTVSEAQEASSLANLAVRLPAADHPSQLLVQPGGSVSMVIDVRQLRAIFEEVGKGEVYFPDSLNGETVSVEVPSLVIALYGDCSYETAKGTGADPDGEPILRGENCTELFQMQSPTVNAPPDLDINQLGNVFLQILGMDPDEAAQFAASVDWTSTLILPVPRSNTTYQDVSVDGAPGTIIFQGDPNDPYHYMLVWVKNGIVYGLSGSDNPDTALELANSMQ